MDTESLITAVRGIIADNTSLSLTEVFSPSLPQAGDNICCVTLIGGNTVNNLCGEVVIYNIMLRVLIRGTESDTTTRALADSIFDALHLLKDTGNIINCIASSTPIYVGIDDNQRILYNITFNLTVK